MRWWSAVGIAAVAVLARAVGERLPPFGDRRDRAESIIGGTLVQLQRRTGD